MTLVDEPLMALIMRFVVDNKDDDVASQQFLQRQLKVLQRHLTQFPAAERSVRAMEWIGEHAARYRRDWERNNLADRVLYLRCADCPLASVDAAEHCEIHEQWLFLLHRYLAGEVTTRDYVENSLAVLTEYKAKHAHRLSVFSAVVEAGKKKSKKRKRNGKKNKKDKKKKSKKSKKK